MTRFTESQVEIFATPDSAATWLKRVLQSWEQTRKARAYAPFEYRFKPNLNPHEILEMVYRALDATGDDAALLQANFRAGAGLLIGEPELLEWHPLSALEIIRLGGRLGSIEILDAATHLMRVANFATVPDASDDRPALLAAEIYHNIVTAPYSGPRFLAFLEACKQHAQNEDVDPSHLLLTLARVDRENWARHVISLTLPLHAFYLRRVGDEGFPDILDFIMEDLLEALDRYSLDFERIFVAGWVLIAGSHLRDKLLFFYNWPPLAALLTAASASSAYRVWGAYGKSGGQQTGNPYARHLSRPLREAACG